LDGRTAGGAFCAAEQRPRPTKETAVAAGGLATLAVDEFGGDPRMPMMPRTWDTDSAPHDDT
jgi:hypothetical protein